MTIAIGGREAVTSVPIDEVHASRWSPRAFDPEATIEPSTLRTLLEAARWSPSASNTQPWRFIVAHRGTQSHAKVVAHLVGFNAAWAGDASALIVNVAETTDATGKRLRWAEYDLGQAAAHLSLQAQRLGLYTHQMGGIEVEGLRAAFALPEHLVPVSVTAVGTLGDPSRLDEKLREREVAPRVRRPLEELLLVED